MQGKRLTGAKHASMDSSWRVLSLGMIACGALVMGCSGEPSNSQTSPTEPGTETAAASSENAATASQVQDYFNRSATPTLPKPAEDRETMAGDSVFGNSGVDPTGLFAGNSNPVDPTLQSQPNGSAGPSGTAGNNATLTGSGGGGVAADAAAQPSAADVDANRLLARIEELTIQQSKAESTEEIRATLIEQADLARQIYDSGTSFSFKVMAVKTRIHALTILDRLKEPTAYDDLIKFGKELMKREEAVLNKMGLLGMVSAQLRQFMLDSEKQPFQDIVDGVDGFTKENHDDVELAREMAAASSQLFRSGKREEAIQMMRVLGANFRRSDNPDIIEVSEMLSAQSVMAEMKLDKIIAGQLANENENLPKLAETMDQMIQAEPTIALYNELSGWMQFFEKEGRYKSIDLMAEKLQIKYREASERDPDKYLQVLDTLDLIRNRMALIGQPASYQGLKMADGGAFDAAKAEGKVVLLTFWSTAANERDRKELQFETRSYEDWRPMGVLMVGFNMDEDATAAKSFFGNHPPRWENTLSDQEGELGYASGFAERYVADRTPYRVLVDHEGKVAHVGVPVERLAQRISELLKAKPKTAEQAD